VLESNRALSAPLYVLVLLRPCEPLYISSCFRQYIVMYSSHNKMS
jgi:hypothetical protein